MKKQNFLKTKKTSDFLRVSAQNKDRGKPFEPPRRGGSNEYPLSLFLSRQNTTYPRKPQFYYIKLGFTRVKII